MASSHDNLSMAVFCDFENVALGVRDANFEKFDIKPVLEKLLLKGSIVVKKAYCDWDRYKGFKAIMHEANFELIEIPHVRQSGKNSADIRMVVDALDLCYTKSHVNTFVIISGDSDFSPLVSKLRENAKQVIGVGVKQSTSDLLVANCDEFIFYDDLVRERQRQVARRQPQQQQPKRSPEESSRRKEEQESRKAEAIEMVVETFDALTFERGDSGKIWASLLKDTLKRRRPDFNETYFGFRTFGNLLEEAQARGLLEFGRDEKSGAYVYRPSGTQAAEQVQVQHQQDAEQGEQPSAQQEQAHAEPATRGKSEPRRRTRGGRKAREEHAEHAEALAQEAAAIAEMPEPVFEQEAAPEPVAEQPMAEEAPAGEAAETPRRRPARKAPARKAKAAAKAAADVAPAEPVQEPEAAAPAEEPAAEQEAAPKRARKPAARPRRPAKPKA
ncbi:NYN domain-containing protein [Pseudoduganella sp. GCM10020061]|uniref:NYN domain-containing protein n=1 Tax=Pseudoduganella sp. GCM10020061 TaxID=3317345 RepID=UPI00362F5F73